MYKRIVRWISALLTLALLFQLTPLLPWGTLFQRAAASTVPAGEEGYTFDIPQASDTTTTAVIPDTFIDLTEAAAPGTANADSAAGFSSTATTASTNSTESTTITTDKELDPSSFQVSAPYLYDSGSNEKVSLNSGALMYESTDYVLPGKNGLDLVIGRRYDSQNASAYSPKVHTEVVNPTSLYYVDWVCDVQYYYPDSDTWADDTAADSSGTLGPYASLTDAQAVAENNTRTTVTDSGDYQTYRYYTASVSHLFTYEYQVSVDKAENDHFTGMYGLGDGWSFLFSSIEIYTHTNRTLHLSDGRSYSLNGNTANPSNIPDYVLDDMVLDYNITEFSNGSVTSYYRLSYQDGRREYFDQDGKLIGIQDRYDNTITLVHSTQNDYPHITITDTVGRVITISGQATETGHAMTVALPDNVNLVYEVAHSGSTDGIEALSAYHDPVGRTTQYSYTIQEYSYSFTSKSALNTSVQVANLTTVTHPTLAQTVYTYELGYRNFGPEGLMGVYKATGRADQVGAETFNQLTYTYSSDDCSGYPTHKNPSNLPEGFTYSTTVTDGQGKVTTAVFNNEHLTTAVTVSHGDTTLQETLYQYSKDKLPIKTTARQYNSSGSYMETITAAEYDAKGNVTAQWSSYAGGDTDNTEHKTTYTYDSTYGLPLTQTYKTNSTTTVRVENTLDEAKQNIVSTKVYVNDTLTRRTDYTYDPYGNITGQKQYHDNLTDYALTEYTYQNGAYLTQEKHSGILAADGTAAQSTPEQEAGVIVTAHTYDALGRRTSTTDGNGNTTSYTYDSVGNVTCVTNPDDTTVTYLYDYAGNKVTVTDENGSRLTYSYTPLGLEFETIDTQTGSVISRREYDACSRLATLSDFVYGGVTRYAYDILGRVTSETVYQDTTVLARILYAYDDGAEGGLYQKVTKTVVGSASALPVVTTQYTNKHGNVIKTGKVLNGTEYFDVNTYDYVGNLLTKLTAADGQKGLAFTARYVYNEANQVVTTYRADGETTTNTYNALGQLVQTTDWAGTPTTYTYDDLGRLLTQTITIDAGVTATSKYDYDPAGNLIREYKPTNAVGEAAHWARVEYSYDSRQRLTAVAQYEGETVAAVTRYTYDGVGNTLTMTCGLTSLEDDSGSTTAYTYDRFGNVLTTTDALGKTETNTYSSLGRLESTTDRNGVTTSYGYDALGRMLSATAGDSVTRYSYTRTGQLSSQWNNWQLTEYTYDELGRVVTVEETRLTDSALVPEPEPEPEVEPEIEAAPGSHIITLVVPDGTLPDGVSDRIILPAGTTYELPTPIRTGYTFTGWYLGDTLLTDTASITEDCVLTAHWEANTYTIVYNLNGGYGTTPRTQTCVYDQEVTLSSVKLFLVSGASGGVGNGWLLNSPTGTFYALGATVKNLTAEPNGTVTLYASYDIYSSNSSLEAETTLSVENPATQTTSTTEETTETTVSAETYTKTYTYDLTGNRTGFTLTLGGETLQSVTYTYDSLNRLSTVSEGGTVQAAYTYDTNGNRATLTYANGVVESYGYNKANWITALTNAKDGTTLSSYAYTYYTSGSQKSETDHTGIVTGYTYDDLGRLTQESETGGLTVDYTYDAGGNRTRMAVSGTETYTVDYTYDANNRLTAENKVQNGVSTYTAHTYDHNGNLLSELDVSGAAVVSHTYDEFNRLISTVAGSTTISYTYNADGIRTARSVGSTTTEYLLDGGNVVGQVVDETTVTSYLRGVNLISGNGSYYLYNAHGDVVQLTNTNGELTKNYNYDAFGNERNPDEEDANPFRYCGEYYDTETGLYYLRARYYDPSVGRFTQKDPIQQLLRKMPNGQQIVDPLSLNRYAYCHNNPVLYVDITGYWIHIAIGALIGGLVSTVLEVGSQLYESNGNWSQIDWGLVLISGATGALGGALTATGVGAVAAGAIVGGVHSLAEQTYTKGIDNVDLLEVGISAGAGALTGAVSNATSGILKFPTIPQKHFNTMSAALSKRIGDAVRYHLGNGAQNEIASALRYYFSQTATLMWQTVIRTLLIEGVKDSVIESIIYETGLPQSAIDELHNFVLSESEA